MGIGLRFEFESVTSLPRMSWCARVGRNGVVKIQHGADVESRGDRFVEGAWDGEFESFAFDKAWALAGSGGLLRDDGCSFTAPFHPLEWLYVLEQADSTLVSNSLVFVLRQAGDGLDLTHPGYTFDVLRTARHGTKRQPGRLRTANGNQVALYEACHLFIDRDLRLHREEMPQGPPPHDYAEYFALLAGATRRIVANAADPARKAVYHPVAACSKGYDSTASAALASLAGCKEGVTFTRSGLPSGHPLLGVDKPLMDDSGADALRALSMTVKEFERMDVVHMPGHPKAEFFYSLTAVTDAAHSSMQDALRGSVFFTGRHGERIWGPTARCKRQTFAEADDCNLAGRASTEFRLRLGYIQMPAPYIGALHGPAIHRITHAEDMRPWKLGTGYYDRPIARRLAEEAGVPRELFGHVKAGGGEAAWELGEESQADFQQFVRERIPAKVREQLNPRPIDERNQAHYKVKYLRTNYSHPPLAARLLDVLQTDRLHRLWNSVYLYTFHWGFEKMSARYAGADPSCKDA